MADGGKDLPAPQPEDCQASSQLLDRRVWHRDAARRWMPVLFAGSCLVYCARMTMPVCAVAMAADFGWNKIHTGVALGAFFWGYSCTQILGGHASDIIGGERMIFLSAASWALVTAATPLLARLGSHTLALMTMARVLMGMLQGVFFPSLVSLVARRSPEGQKSFLTSISQSGSSLGILLAGVLGSIMLERYGWESVFYAVASLSALWALLVWRRFLKGRLLCERRQDSRSESFSCTRLLNLLRKPCVCAAVFAHMCTCGTSFTLLSWMPTYFSQEYPHATTWQYNVFPWAAAIPVALCSGRLSDWLIGRGFGVAFVRKSMQFIAMGVSSAFVLPLSTEVSFPMAVACISAAMVALSFTTCGVSVNVQDLAPTSAGALYGVMNTLGAFTGLLMVSLSGYAVEVTRSWASVFTLVVSVHTAGLAVFVYFGDARPVDVVQESDSSPLLSFEKVQGH
ncbi:solute carrier family 17 member 9-like [Corythoichthys intestinalis]|uniref:solute carrier family 17 member 9-like n=1 Tax=Corythoichthys intestinalis TaxID=161448 RepID=UPI0025A51548|nr:solute carrier family 17 member 9-like [Corythoichthys intestinalis]